MFTSIDKALVALVMALAYLGNAVFGIDLGWDIETVETIVVGLTPILVWLVPNRVKARSVPDVLRSHWAGTLAVLLIGMSLAGCVTSAAPEVRWAQVQQGYNDALAALIDYRRPCVPSTEWPDGGPDHALCRVGDLVYRQIEPIRASIDASLRVWERAPAGGSTADLTVYLEQAERGLLQLRGYLAAAEAGRR